MTIQGAMKQLEEMRDHPMMPIVFKPLFDKVIETIADEFAPTKDDIYWGYTATIDRPLADKEIVFRLRAIQKQIGGSYAIDRAIEVIEEVQELFERHGHVAGGNKKDVTDTNVGNKGGPIEKQAAIEAVRHAWAKGLEPTQFLEDLPPAQPEIVRCKDCENWDTSWQNDYAPNYHYCPLVDGIRRDDFYCADAERRGKQDG